MVQRVINLETEAQHPRVHESIRQEDGEEVYYYQVQSLSNLNKRLEVRRARNFINDQDDSIDAIKHQLKQEAAHHQRQSTNTTFVSQSSSLSRDRVSQGGYYQQSDYQNSKQNLLRTMDAPFAMTMPNQHAESGQRDSFMN